MIIKKINEVILIVFSVLVLSSVLIINLKAEESITPAAIGNTIQETFPDPYFAQVVADNVSAGDVNAILTEEMVSGFTFLVASNTQISDLTGIGHLTALDVIALNEGQIKSVPAEIGNLTALTYLNLGGNKITILPKEIGNLTSLGVLAVNNNYLTSLPQEIENMPSLVSLEVSSNLLPTDTAAYLESLPGFENIVSAVPQRRIQLTNTGLEFNILNQQDIDDVQDMGNILTNVDGNTMPAGHTFIIDQYEDVNGPVNINDYIKNGIVIQSGTLYAKLRATGEGLFPNNSDNAITDDYIKLNFEVTYYNLIFDLNGGFGTIPAIQTLIEGDIAAEVDQPIRDGYTFKGWNTLADGSGIVWDFALSTMPANDVTLYAEWSINQHELSFDLNGGEGTAPVSQDLDFDTLATQPQPPIRAGYTFNGWNTQQDGTGIIWDFTVDRMPDNNIVLYAQWEKNVDPIVEYTLRFDLNGGQGVAPTNQILNEGQKASKPTNPSREEYVFKGWNTTKDGSGTAWDFETNTMPANDVTLYAQWSKQNLPVTGDSSNAISLSSLLVVVGATVIIINKRRILK